MTISYLNLRSSLATDPMRNFRFIARFTPLGPAGPEFTSTIGFVAIQGLNMQTEAIPYREGGYNTTLHYLPGQQTFSPVTFQRGVTIGSSDHWDWFLKLFDPGTRSVGSGTNSTGASSDRTANYRCQVTIDVLGHPAPKTQSDVGSQNVTLNGPQTMLRFKLLNAWPTNIAYSDLNAADNAVLVEQMTVVHEGMDVQWVAARPYLDGNAPSPNGLGPITS